MTEIAARLIGCFYIFAGVLVFRLGAMEHVLDQALAAVSTRAPDVKERLQSFLLTMGATLTLMGGCALALLDGLATPIFVLNLLVQGGYLLWARKALPPEDADEARGRRRTLNAFIVYVAATAFVFRLDVEGVLSPPGVLAAAVCGAAGVAAVLLWRPRVRPTPPDEQERSVYDDEDPD